MGPERSLRKLLPEYRLRTGGKRIHGKVRNPGGLIQGWSMKFRWVERAEAFDAHEEQQRLQRNRRRLIRAQAAHADQAASIRKALSPLVDKVAAAAKEIELADDMDPEDLVRLGQIAARTILEAQRAEREALGPINQPTDMPDQQKIAARASKLRLLMADPAMVTMFEQTEMEVSAEERRLEAQSGHA